LDAVVVVELPVDVAEFRVVTDNTEDPTVEVVLPGGGGGFPAKVVVDPDPPGTPRVFGTPGVEVVEEPVVVVAAAVVVVSAIVVVGSGPSSPAGHVGVA
jgi:hypothetical protein